MNNDKLTRALQDEMKHVSFGDDKKQRLAMQLKQAMHAGASTSESISPGPQACPNSTKRFSHRSPSTGWWNRFAERVAAFWNGTAEIPIHAAAMALVLIGIGVWDQLSPLLLVDQNAAALLMRAGTETEKVTTIGQGVSLL